MGRLDGKVALITGGASGMGMVASKLFASEGAAIVLTDVADDAGEAVAAEIEAAGGRTLYVHSDASDEADAEAMVKAAVDRFGGLTILYNNAGVMMSQDGSVTDTDVSVWDTTLGINVKGVAFGCKYGVPAMIASGGGSIINVASFVACWPSSWPIPNGANGDSSTSRWDGSGRRRSSRRRPCSSRATTRPS